MSDGTTEQIERGLQFTRYLLALQNEHLSDEQRRVSTVVFLTMAKRIYGDTWEPGEDHVSKNRQVAIVAKQGSGTTHVLDVHHALTLLTVPGVQLNFFAANKRLARDSLERIVCMIQKHEYFTKHGLTIATRNRDRVELLWPCGKRSVLDVFPLNYCNIRGLEGDSIVIDDAHLASDVFMEKGVLPLFQQGHTALVLVGVSYSDSFFSRYIEHIDPDTTIHIE
jgi:hypothetical protein